jgi:hypothetical protein
MTFKRTYERWGLKDGEGKLRIETSGGQGSRRALVPSDDDDDEDDKYTLFTSHVSSKYIFAMFRDLIEGRC